LAFPRRNSRHRPVSQRHLDARHQARIAREQARHEVLNSYLRFIR
jgi:hypothetical protein